MRPIKQIAFSVAAAAFFLGGSPAGATLSDGLLSYWNFDGNLDDVAHSIAGSSSTVADNGVFDGANGTGGISFAGGLFGQGIEQNGASGANQNDGFVRVTRSADTLAGATSTLTTSLWLQTAGFDTNWQTLIAHGEGSNYRVSRRGGGPVVSYAGGSGDIPISDSIGPNIGAGTGWHHVLAISEGGVSTRLWVDGGLVATGGVPTINDNGNSNPPNPDLFIGANPQTGANNREWWGMIDDVAQWSRPLSEDEISSIYRGGTSGSSLGRIISSSPVPDSGTTALLGLLAFAGLGFLRRFMK